MSFVVTMNRLPAAAAALRSQAGIAVAKVAADVLTDAQSRAPVDTGYLRASGYAQTEGDLTWRVGFGAEYHIYVELGTYKMSARPHLIPAWNAGRYRLMQAMRSMGLFG